MAKISHSVRLQLFNYLLQHQKAIEENTLTFKQATLNFKGSDGKSISETFLREVCTDIGIVQKTKPKQISGTSAKIDILITAMYALYERSVLDTPVDLKILMDQLPIKTSLVELIKPIEPIEVAEEQLPLFDKY